MTIEYKLDCAWLFVNSICCTGMTSFLLMMIFQWIVYIRNQTHALYIKYFNPYHIFETNIMYLIKNLNQFYNYDIIVKRELNSVNNDIISKYVYLTIIIIVKIIIDVNNVILSEENLKIKFFIKYIIFVSNIW
jgi:hypothetical protein